ncbi:DnaJ-like protein subfamily C member 3 [Hypsibius exemplaris]|uniref:DnaJ-like protein subfamily C member 3 n=1 Tax=Hypsibius exemplaris TaxID=2072580 RepID=A0A1W0WZM6_HYPEX|nr:DnaJ-like protein subfamily C member 3 [Hypsibius exemplaris]
MILVIASRLCFLWILWASLDMHLVLSITKEEVANHLEQAKLLLGKGQLADALSHYHAAIDGDPGNYMAYFKRATVYLALGRAKSALNDMERVIELKPDFLLARTQRANLLVKQGRFEEAIPEYEFILVKEMNNADAQNQLQLITQAKRDLVFGQEALSSGDYHTAVQYFTRALEISPSDPETRNLRAEAYEAAGDYPASLSDIRQVAKLQAEHTEPHLRLSLALYKNGEAEESLNAIRECLKLDADYQPCKKHYTFVRKFVKQLTGIQEDINANQYAECVQKCDVALGLDTETDRIVRDLNGKLCLCASKVDGARGVKVCTALLEIEPENPDYLINRADSFIANEQYEEAVNDFQEAVKHDGENRRAREGVERAKKLLKQAQRRDYYKILGLKRNVQKDAVLKAYRKLAKQWHPDRFSDPQEKEHAQKKFMDIAAAMEVLSDSEKRQKYDAGEDPLDPEQQSRGGHPFGGGFNPFGQGQPFTFHFQQGF